MGNFATQFLDPGGEYYYSLGPSAVGIWTGGATGWSCVNNAPAGRATQYALFCSSGGSSTLSKNFNNYASWCLGFAISWSSFGTAPTIIRFQDAGTLQCDLRATSTGSLYFTRNGTQIGGNSSNLLTPGAWYYIEVKAVIASGTSGSMEVRVNGVVWLTVTGVSTQNTANAYANQVLFSGNNSSQYVKDIYVMADTSSGPHSSYLGDITVAVSYPSGAGANSAWAANGAASDWKCVDDNPGSGTAPDGDTTYISSATAGQIADFAHGALSLTGSILAVAHASYLRKDDAGTRQVAQVCLSSGTQETSPNISLGNTYQYYFDILEDDPHTSAAWSLSGFNAATFGVEEIS